MKDFIKSEDGFIDLKGIEYFLMAGAGAIVGLLICVVILLPLSIIWPAAWNAAFWVIGGFTAAGLIFAAGMSK